MFAQKLLLPAFAVLSVAAAQTASICSQATATINSQADATQYADCSTISGDVLISADASGTIALDGPQQITGNLICHNAGQLTSLSSTSIGSIGKAFDLFNLTLLSTLQMSDLQSANNISWNSLPALSSLTMPAVISKATYVLITNTFLSTLDGINLKTVSSLNINNNNRLKTFSTQVANITGSLNIDSNGKLLDVSFPNLIWAANMTLRNVSTLSIPSLATVNGSLGLYENYFSSVAAPNLTSVGNTGTLQGSLAFVANPSLANISMPQLQSVGGANQIANNSALEAISFPTLSFVGGAIDFSGNFSTPALPDLTNVKGGFNVQSTASIDCSGFQSEKGSVIQGTFTCGTTANPTTKGSGTGTVTGSSASSTSTKGAASSYGVSETLAGLGLIGTLMHMLL